jgi:predicted PurR-regulated permease PerM
VAQDTTIRRQQVRFWLLVLLVTAFCIWLLRGVLLPFVAGAAIAFFLHPLADRLERWVGRNLAALLLVVLFILLLAALLAFLAPIVVSQLGGLIANLPSYVDALGRLVDPMVEWARRHLGEEQFQQIREQFGSAGGQIMSVIGSVVGGVWQSSVAMISLLSLLLITPVVAFYLLRDWNRMMEAIKAYLPVNRRETIIDLGRQVDATLAGFLRGQGLVCVILGTFYAVALTVAGLNFAVVIGLISGLLTFIPYVGSITGFVLSMGIAFAQFDVWWMWVIIAAIFLFGQAVEGNIITPKLVGDAVNLHAVWVIFALMAGGALFGFTGVLLAVPVAAVIGVLIRFGLRVYRESKYFDPDHLLDEDETADVAGPDSSKPSAREQGHDR